MNNRTRAYTYDDIGRLRGETISGDIDLNMTYAYDMRGNRTGKTVTGDENYTISSTYDNNNRLTKQTKSADGIQTNATQYYYDNNGNQTFKQHFTYSTGELMSMSVGTESDDIESFTYNARNQLTGYTKGSTNASYTYGANGLRKSKTVGSSTTGFVWNGNNLAAEKISGSIQNIYSYGTDGIAVSKQGNTLSYYLKDAHGNVICTTSASGNITQPYSYDAFGNHLDPPSATDTNPFGYCGEYYDNESGNIYLRARYYDTANGRFIGEDPIKDGLNWYSYCAGNPVLYCDIKGLRPKKTEYGLSYSEDNIDTVYISDNDEFETRDEAVIDAGNYLMMKTSADGKEHIGFILKNKNGTYSYTEIRNKSKTPEISCQYDKYIMGDKKVFEGTIHTHPYKGNCYAADDFSNANSNALGGNKGDIEFADEYHELSYVVAGNGVIKEYNPNIQTDQNMRDVNSRYIRTVTTSGYKDPKYVQDIKKRNQAIIDEIHKEYPNVAVIIL